MVTIHNIVNPIRPDVDAENWARQFKGFSGTVTCFGFSFHHAQAFNHAAPEAAVVYMDPRLPDTKLINATLPARQKVGRTWGEWKEHWSALANRWKPVRSTHLTAFDVAFQQEHRAFCYQLGREIQAMVSDRCTSIRFGYEWQTNYLSNLRFLNRCVPVSRMFDRMKGHPVILVSSGPSLDKNVQLLAEAKGRALVIAVGSAFTKLHRLGIEPDFAISFDGGVYNSLGHFAGLRSQLPLIFDPILHSKVLEEYPGRLIVMSIWPGGMLLDRPTGCDVGYVSIGPSVSCTAFALAYKMGANPIVFIGQDCAFSEDRTHASGTHVDGTIDADNAYALRAVHGDRQPVEGQNGEQLISNPSLLTFKHWFEETIRGVDPARIVLNATEGGANIRGARNISFREVLDVHCRRDISVDIDSMTKALFAPHTFDISRCIEHLRASRVCAHKLIADIAADRCEPLAKELPNPRYAMIAFSMQAAWEQVQCGLKDKEIYPLITDAMQFTLPLLDRTIESLEKQNEHGTISVH